MRRRSAFRRGFDAPRGRARGSLQRALSAQVQSSACAGSDPCAAPVVSRHPGPGGREASGPPGRCGLGPRSHSRTITAPRPLQARIRSALPPPRGREHCTAAARRRGQRRGCPHLRPRARSLSGAAGPPRAWARARRPSARAGRLSPAWSTPPDRRAPCRRGTPAPPFGRPAPARARSAGRRAGGGAWRDGSTGPALCGRARERRPPVPPPPSLLSCISPVFDAPQAVELMEGRPASRRPRVSRRAQAGSRAAEPARSANP